MFSREIVIIAKRSAYKKIPFNALMLTIASILVGFWFFALMMSYTLGGFIHLLLIAAIVLALVRIIEGNDPLSA
jgi:hypothetical protein